MSKCALLSDLVSELCTETIHPVILQLAEVAIPGDLCNKIPQMSNEATFQSIILRTPAQLRYGGLVAVAIIGALGLGFFGGTVLLLSAGYVGISLLLAALTAVFVLLLRYMLRDFRGKWNWRITIESDALDLNLPRGRSLVGKPEPIHAKLGFDEIDAIETRLEAYKSLGMANMQRNYALRLKTGKLIVLGEDRALGTNMAPTFMADAIQDIVRVGDLPIRDLGMAEGRGGFLSILFASPPKWETSNLTAGQQSALWNAAKSTGSWARIMSVIVAIAALLSLVF